MYFPVFGLKVSCGRMFAKFMFFVIVFLFQLIIVIYIRAIIVDIGCCYINVFYIWIDSCIIGLELICLILFLIMVCLAVRIKQYVSQSLQQQNLHLDRWYHNFFSLNLFNYGIWMAGLWRMHNKQVLSLRFLFQQQ